MSFFKRRLIIISVTILSFGVAEFCSNSTGDSEEKENEEYDFEHRFPLRVPEALRPMFKSHLATKSRTPRQMNGQGQQLMPGVYTCDQQGSDMFINVINPSFPDQDTEAGNCNFKVRIRREEVCQVRIDFVDTELLSPTNGNCIEQHLQIRGTVLQMGFNRLCGINTDQHFYVHIDKSEPLRQREVDIAVVTVASKVYKFGLWITQIECDGTSAMEAPSGCTQYFLGQSGIIKTFNFEGVQYLASTNYNICIRTEKDACFMQLEADSGQFMFQLHISRDNRRFMRLGRSRNPSGRGAEDCGLDYLVIPNGRPNATALGRSYDRFCGGHLNINSNRGGSMPIYSEITSPIFKLRVVTTVRNEDTTRLTSPPRTRFSNMRFGNFISLAASGSLNTRINRPFEDTGVGMRLRFSQQGFCGSHSSALVV